MSGEVDEPRDHESVYGDGPGELGVPVDPPDRKPVFAQVVARTDNRKPIVPASLRSKDQRQLLYRWAVRLGLHTSAYHATRTPKYAWRVSWYAPRGAWRLTWRLTRWAVDWDNWLHQQEAVRKLDAEMFLKLVRASRAPQRLIVVVAAVVAATCGGMAGHFLLPSYLQITAAVLAVLGLARFGRPAGKPITDRVYTGPRLVKLTAEMVRGALMSMALPGLKEPGQLVFPQEIHRDGPGYLAVVDLPPGLDAVKVVEDKRKLASGLRKPADQVWPETMPKAHPGRLAIWVGDQPASETKQPPWSLLGPAAQVDVFKQFDLCTDPRLRPVKVGLLFRNWLIGGQPGSGKTVSARDIALACSLDARVELRLFELKGTGDLDPLEPLCTDFASGADDETAEAAARAVQWAYQECGRRGKLIKHYAKLGRAPENKVTPELANAGVGLNPVLLVIDEAQELFTHPEFGDAAGVTLEKAIKLGRALGIIIVISTQIPDKKSLPPNITRCVNSRLCHSVADWYANDAILGTGMYKNGYRATEFVPVDDAGWGILAGFGPTGPVRSYNPNEKAIARIVARSLSLRGGPAERTEADRVPAYNLLEDVRRVMLPGEDALWSELLVPRLAELRPEVYGDMDVNVFGASMRAAGCPTSSIHRKIEGKGVTRYGVKLDALEAVLGRKAIG
jgi:S-DNA-T family DNA segregation ATPase FtsK/SpoIIIE